MNTMVLLDMAAGAFGERVAVGGRAGWTYDDLRRSAVALAKQLAHAGVKRVALLDTNSEAVPLLLFACSAAGIPFVPLNYRLADDQLVALLERTAPCTVVVDSELVPKVTGIQNVSVVERKSLLDGLGGDVPDVELADADPESIAVLLYTSGTTGTPKAAVLRQRHLTSYVLSTVEFMGASETDAAIVCVPPYHIAGVASVLSAAYSGRRLVYLPQFSPERWVSTVIEEAVTHAMVVPTMLHRILDELDAHHESLPSLRHIAYGGGRMPVETVERAMRLLPSVDFVNAYGLTETSSTIAVLGPADHREAIGSDVQAVRSRLGSVGRPLPSLELEIRDPTGTPLAAGERGEIFVRGEQIAGEYLHHSVLSSDGWFATHDEGWLDADGFLFVLGRLDDVIVRGGENISPGDVEDVLIRHPDVAEAAVVGLPDEEWGEIVAAVVVLREGRSLDEAEIQSWIRGRLRSSKTPSRVLVRDELPYNETGKILRRVLKAEMLLDEAVVRR